MATADSALVQKIRQRGQEGLAQARQVLRSDAWRFEARTPDGDEVHSCSVAGVGRVLMITAFYNCPARSLKKILIDGVEDYPKWSNSYVKDSCKRLMVLGDEMDVARVVTSARLGGLVAARDWVSVRHWRDGEDEAGAPETLSSGVAVAHPDYPPGKRGLVRCAQLGDRRSPRISAAPGCPRTC